MVPWQFARLNHVCWLYWSEGHWKHTSGCTEDTTSRTTAPGYRAKFRTPLNSGSCCTGRWNNVQCPRRTLFLYSDLHEASYQEELEIGWWYMISVQTRTPEMFSKLTIYTSDLLVGFREPIRSSSKSIETSNIIIQMCSIVYFVVIINGKWPCYLTPSSYANHPQDASMEKQVNTYGTSTWIRPWISLVSTYVMMAYLSLKYLANDRTARLRYNDHGYASFGSD